MFASYFNITVIAEWCTFIAAIFLLNKRTGIWQLFIPFFFLILVTETLGWYFHNVVKRYENALPFNILLVISDFFFLWLFSKADVLKKEKRLIVYSLVFFVVFSVINLFLFEGFWRYNSFSDTLGSILMITVCCYLLFVLVKKEEYLDLLRYDYFWLAIGLLFYSLGSIILYHFTYLLMDFAKETKIDIGTYINYSINLILYASLIIAFICRRKITNLLRAS